MKATFAKVRRPVESYNRRRLAATGLLVLAAVVLATTLISGLDAGKIRYTARFAQAAQISSGHRVTVAGIEVGTVKDVRLAGDHVEVTFSVRRDVPVGRDSRAAIKLTTILGTRYLELAPAGDGEPPGRTIDLAHTEVPYDMQDTLAGATSTLTPIDAERIAQSVRVMNDNLHGLPEALPQALANINALATVIADRRGQLGTLLDNANAVTALLHRQKADLGALVTQGNDILGEVTARRAAMQRLFDGVTVLVDRARTVLDDEPQLDALITNMHEFARMLREQDALVRNFLQVAPVAVRNLANASGSGNAMDINVPAGPFVDSWMCALSGRARQFNLVEYFKDCQ